MPDWLEDPLNEWQRFMVYKSRRVTMPLPNRTYLKHVLVPEVRATMFRIAVWADSTLYTEYEALRQASEGLSGLSTQLKREARNWGFEVVEGRPPTGRGWL